MKVGGGEEKEVEIKGIVGVKQGGNLGPILFILLIQAISSTLDKKWNFSTPDFRRHALKKDGEVKDNPSRRRKVSTILQGIPFSF